MGRPALTPVQTALAGVTDLAIDTSPFIYFIERHPKYLPIVRPIFERVSAGEISAFSSAITLCEVLTRPIQLGRADIEREYLELLTHSRNLRLGIVDQVVAVEAARLRAKYSLKTPDALQVAHAILWRCQAFLTNDRGLQRVTELRVLVVDDLV